MTNDEDFAAAIADMDAACAVEMAIRADLMVAESATKEKERTVRSMIREGNRWERYCATKQLFYQASLCNNSVYHSLRSLYEENSDEQR